MRKQKIICPKCGRKEVVKRGYIKTKISGKKQRYYCKSCNRKFIPRDAFYRMRNNPEKITLSIDLFYRGVSTRKVQEHLGAFYPHNADHSTILRWIRKYSEIISNFTNHLKLNIGDEIQVDEIEYHRRKSHKAKKGISKDWFIDSICPQTKFMIASKYAKARGHKEIKEVISKAKERTENQIKKVTTDGLNAYNKVVKKVFGYSRKTRSYNVFHNRVIVSENEGRFNYPIERLHNSVRHRTKTFRGFHGSVESANLILKGFEIYYNFITKHQALDCCPYELATDLKLKSNNKWLELINLANQKDLKC